MKRKKNLPPICVGLEGDYSISYAVIDVDVSKHETHGVIYPDVDELPRDKFLTLNEYIEIAKACIHNKVYNEVVRFALLDSEDAVAYLVHSMVYADWRYKDDVSLMSQRNYRFSRCGFSIRSYLKACGSQQNIKLRSISHSLDENKDTSAFNADSRFHTPDFIVEQKDWQEKILEIIDTCGLTCKQKHCVTSYYIDNQTYSEIAERTKVSRQAVIQYTNRAIEIIRCHPSIKQLKSLME